MKILKRLKTLFRKKPKYYHAHHNPYYDIGIWKEVSHHEKDCLLTCLFTHQSTNIEVSYHVPLGLLAEVPFSNQRIDELQRDLLLEIIKEIKNQQNL